MNVPQQWNTANPVYPPTYPYKDIYLDPTYSKRNEYNENDYDSDDYDSDEYEEDCYDSDGEYCCEPVLEKGPMVV